MKYFYELLLIKHVMDNPVELFEKVGGILHCYYETNICEVEQTNLRFCLEEHTSKVRELIRKTPEHKIGDILPAPLYIYTGAVKRDIVKKTVHPISHYPQCAIAVGISISTLNDEKKKKVYSLLLH
jgi:hypothetical protein